jgi:hypothetical protein
LPGLIAVAAIIAVVVILGIRANAKAKLEAAKK